MAMIVFIVVPMIRSSRGRWLFHHPLACRGRANFAACALRMKSLFHLFYLVCVTVPVFINLFICFVSYRWHTQFRAVITKELEQLRKGRAG